MSEKVREQIRRAKRIVVKIGTSVLTHNTVRLDDGVFKRLASEMAQLKKEAQKEIILVSSGAIMAGLDLLGLDPNNPSLAIPDKQGAASVGQGHLIRRYENHFSKFKIPIGQMLLTHDDLSNRRRYLNARHTLLALLKHGVIPIINENDSVVVDEIKFGDNDTLSALITPLAQADLLILLTDLDGLHDADPRKNPQAQLISLVKEIDEGLLSKISHEGHLGVGGMATKIQAAKRAVSYGVPTVIANGHEAGIMGRILKGEALGTLFLPKKDPLASRKHWIAHTLRGKGKVHLDAGAHRAVVEGGKSLLPSGITEVSGDFDIGDAVILVSENDEPLAQGLVSYNSKELGKIKGLKSDAIDQVLGYKYYDEVIHRDDLVLLKPKEKKSKK